MRIPQNISKIALLYNNLSRTLKGLVSLNPTLMLTMILRMATTSGGETTVIDYAAFFLIVQVAKL
jgi:hypothetical protein